MIDIPFELRRISGEWARRFRTKKVMPVLSSAATSLPEFLKKLAALAVLTPRCSGVCGVQAFAHCMSTTARLGALREKFPLAIDKLYDNGIMMSS